MPKKKLGAYAVYTNLPPAGAVRGYGMTQPVFAVESVMDELARALGMYPFELRRNAVRPGDPMVSISEEPEDVECGSYGLDQCLDLVEQALANALADATGARFRDLPFTPDRIYRRIFERHVV